MKFFGNRCHWTFALIALLSLSVIHDAFGQDKAKVRRPREPELTYPPQLPGGQSSVTVESRALLIGPPHIADDVIVAREPPRVDFVYFPGQDYPGKPWSNWGDSTVVEGKYYASIGDHLAPRGNAFVFQYDPMTKSFRLLADIAKTLELPPEHYVPGKIHTRLDLAQDGWIYFGTHRGSTRVTNDENHYLGDWIMRCHPESAECEVVARNPVAKHCIPTSVVDTQRMIFYGSTAPGSDAELTETQLFAFDLRDRKAIFSGGDGPSRAIVLSRSTGRIYYTPGTSDSPLMRFDTASDEKPNVIPGKIGIRAATSETDDGIVYTIAAGRQSAPPMLYALNTKTDEIKTLQSAAVGTQGYVASVDVDQTGRYLYYVPGAHGGSYRDGTPIVQYDTQKNQKKVLAFLEPYFQDHYGCSLRGTYSTALSAEGDKLFITWNVSRGSRAWDCCALTVLHIPAFERP